MEDQYKNKSQPKVEIPHTAFRGIANTILYITFQATFIETHIFSLGRFPAHKTTI
jgi:hypothetical protein